MGTNADSDALARLGIVLAKEAVDNFLIDDEQTACLIVQFVRMLGAQYSWLAPNRSDRAEYRGDLPAGYSFLRSLPKPVFASASLVAPGNAPSLWLPNPFRALVKPGKSLYVRFFEALCVAEPDTQPPDEFPSDGNEDAWVHGFALPFCHALANGMLQVRVEDTPKQTLLAYAHSSLEPLYIPDVDEVRYRPGDPAQSVAQDEEAFLAMKSVLYVPLKASPLLSRWTDREERVAMVVVILWSPIKNYWATLKCGTQIMHGVFRVTEDVAGFAEHLNWLGRDAVKESKLVAWGELGVLSVIASVKAAVHHASAEVKEFVSKKIEHGIAPLAALALREKPARAGVFTVERWIEFMLDEGLGTLPLLRLWWQDCPQRWAGVEFEYQDLGQESPIRGLQWRTLLAEHPVPTGVTPLTDEVADAICSSMAAEIAERANRLHRISIRTSASYVSIAFSTTLHEYARDGLAGSTHSFERYYGLKRQLVLAPTADGGARGMGLGNALHGALNRRLGIYRNLYLHPDYGKSDAECRVEIAVPYVRGS